MIKDKYHKIYLNICIKMFHKIYHPFIIKSFLLTRSRREFPQNDKGICKIPTAENILSSLSGKILNTSPKLRNKRRKLTLTTSIQQHWTFYPVQLGREKECSDWKISKTIFIQNKLLCIANSRAHTPIYTCFYNKNWSSRRFQDRWIYKN